MRRVSYADRLRREAALSVTNLRTSESEFEKWLVCWVAYAAIVPTCERAGEIDGDDKQDRRWHTMKEGDGVQVFVDEKSNKRGRDLSDLVITSAGCAKEVVISYLDASWH
jgi:hypothetical protein